MKKIVSLLLAVLLILTFGVFALGSGESDDGVADQGNGTANGTTVNDNIGDYSLVIDSCRLAEDYEGDPVVIVKYKFTNNSNDNATAFYVAFEDHAYQNGVGLNEAYILKESANYNSDNQTKEIKKGASIDVEVAYELNDTESDVEVEVKEFISFNDKTITKTFTLK